MTFYCPRTLLAAIEIEMVRSGRSKTAVIVDALRAHLAAPAGQTQVAERSWDEGSGR